jgi:hypothetical protein
MDPKEQAKRIKNWVDSFVKKAAVSDNVRVDGCRMDAGETAMLAQQLEYMMAELFDVEYPELKSRRFFPVDNSVPTGAETFSYRQYDKMGRAKIIGNYSDDLPLVNVQGTKFVNKIVGLGDGYEISIQSIRAAAMAGVPLDSTLADTARMAIEQSIDELAAFGDADAGLSGFLNEANIPLVAPSTGTWSTASADEIIADVQKLWQSIPTATNQIHMPDTLLVDTTSWGYLQRPRSTDNDTSIAKWLLGNLEGIRNIDQWYKLDTADAKGWPDYHPPGV